MCNRGIKRVGGEGSSPANLRQYIYASELAIYFGVHPDTMRIWLKDLNIQRMKGKIYVQDLEKLIREKL